MSIRSFFRFRNLAPDPEDERTMRATSRELDEALGEFRQSIQIDRTKRRIESKILKKMATMVELMNQERAG